MFAIWKSVARCRIVRAGFVRSENGAVTVEWVVLTAAVVGLGLTAVVATQSSTDTVATNARSFFQNYTIGQ